MFGGIARKILDGSLCGSVGIAIAAHGSPAETPDGIFRFAQFSQAGQTIGALLRDLDRLPKLVLDQSGPKGTGASTSEQAHLTFATFPAEELQHRGRILTGIPLAFGHKAPLARQAMAESLLSLGTSWFDARRCISIASGSWLVSQVRSSTAVPPMSSCTTILVKGE